MMITVAQNRTVSQTNPEFEHKKKTTCISSVVIDFLFPFFFDSSFFSTTFPFFFLDQTWLVMLRIIEFNLKMS